MSAISSQTWADTPFTLIPTPFGPRDASKEHASLMMAQNVTHIHNCLLRVLNSIYNQAPHVHAAKDKKDLLQLAKLWHDELEHHHHTEEEVFFPMLEKITGQEGIMEGNVEQHHQFEPGLEALKKYSTETTPETYKYEELRQVIDSFAPVLRQHLADEIDTLLGLKIYPSEELAKAWKATHEHVLKTCDNTVQLPILMHAFDATFEGKAVGPAFPWFLYYLVRYVFERKHADSWRFLPCSIWGQPRPLPFIGN
jgi:hemerythrin-like domain-containing protein